MPRYQVISTGFYDSKLYGPKGKRKTLTTDKAFKKCPDWLKPIQEESADQRKKRETKAEKQARIDAEKAAEDKKDIDAVTFTSAPSTAQVVTL